MDVDKLSNVVRKGFLTAAFTLFAVACTEWALSWFELTLLRNIYTPGRLLEFAAIFLVFVIALLLRQIREELRKPRA